MHCQRVHAQSLIVNGKLIVIGGEVFGDGHRAEDVRTEQVGSEPALKDGAEIAPKSVHRDRSCIEEYDFELQRWDVLCSLPTVLWQHSACCIHRAYDFGSSDTNTSSYDTFSNGVATEIFIGNVEHC